jgi:hypothetical protein
MTTEKGLHNKVKSAYHFTSEQNAISIFKNQHFIASTKGFYGSGLYASLSINYGKHHKKNDYCVTFCFTDLNILSEEDLRIICKMKNSWDEARVQMGLSRIGADGFICFGGEWLIVTKYSIQKIAPMKIYKRIAINDTYDEISIEDLTEKRSFSRNEI